METYSIKHNLTEWRMFINSPKVSLKAVLLHNGNKFSLHSTSMKKTYNFKFISENLQHAVYEWSVCGDL